MAKKAKTSKKSKKETSTKKEKPKKAGKKVANRRYRIIATKIGAPFKDPTSFDVISTGPTCAMNQFYEEHPGWCAWNYDDPIFICYTEDPGELFPNAIKTALDLERVEEA